MTVFHCSRLTPTRCLLLIGHVLHPSNACFSLAMVYAHVLFVSVNHFVDFIYDRMYASTTFTEVIAGHGDIRITLVSVFSTKNLLFCMEIKLYMVRLFAGCFDSLLTRAAFWKIYSRYLSLPPTRHDLTQGQKPEGRLKWG